MPKQNNKKTEKTEENEWEGDRKVNGPKLSDCFSEKKGELLTEIKKSHHALLEDTNEFLDAMDEFHKNVENGYDWDDYGNNYDDYMGKLHKAKIDILDILINVSQGKITKEEIKTQLQAIEWPDTNINAKPVEIMKGILFIFLGTLTGLATLVSGAVFGISVLVAQPLPAVVSGAATVGLAGVTCALFDKGLSFFKSPKEKMEDSLEKLAKNIEKNDEIDTKKDSTPLLVA